MLSFMDTLGKLLYKFVVKSRKIRRGAAGHQALIYYDLFVYPFGTGVDKVYPDVLY